MKTYTVGGLRTLIEEYLASMPYSRQPKGLYDPIEYVLGLGGKRIRPILMLLAYNLYREDINTILPQAVGLETYHNHTLLHDDLMDNADMRRGNPTVHVKWNANTAILSGDAMLILAYRLMNTSLACREVMDEFVEATMQICEGQQWDMEFETRADVTVDEYIEMIRLKTSVLLAAALKIGAMLAGAPASDVDRLYRMGTCMGLAFQLQDDYLDVYGDVKVFGKNIGGDILCNKKTYMLIQALKKASPEQREEMTRWMERTEYEPAEKIKTFTKIYDSLHVGEDCRALVDSYYTEGLSLLAEMSVPADRLATLRQYVCSWIKREN
ncbi:MAG: polyprenyl synthetase family protein [Bacteroidales bacterium]|nr:polyprenyl synthetase family protein [Bacteroidales bacterium]